MHAIAVAPVAEAVPSALAAATDSVDAFEPWTNDSLALTFLDGGMERAPAFGTSLDRLRALKAQWDPRNVFAAGNPV